jgi:hypothetical protein
MAAYVLTINKAILNSLCIRPKKCKNIRIVSLDRLSAFLLCETQVVRYCFFLLLCSQIAHIDSLDDILVQSYL